MNMQIAQSNNTLLHKTKIQNGAPNCWCLSFRMKLIGISLLCFAGSILYRETIFDIISSGSSSSVGGTRLGKQQQLVNNDGSSDQNVEKKSSPTIQQIILLGERHSGTNWITDYLVDCFGNDIKVSNDYKRGKHFFQEDDIELVPENSAVVVAMFRDPHDWVEAMRIEPHHSFDHVDWHGLPINYTRGWRQQGATPLPWHEFVTKPWIGRRGKADRIIQKTVLGYPMHANCTDGYKWVDVAPCSEEDALPEVPGLGMLKYEYRKDGSERGFSSIIDLRRAKILNLLSVANFRGTKAFFPYRFEQLKAQGTSGLLNNIEETTGLKAKCKATKGKSPGTKNVPGHQTIVITKHGDLSDDYVKWMDQYVDWEVESKIGYSRRGGGGSDEELEEEPTAVAAEEETSPLTTNNKTLEKIILLGERHSGTNWITDYLTSCFDIKVDNHYKRYKHWFQEDDIERVPGQSAVVIVLFRDPFDWIEAMRVEPHHSPYHLKWIHPFNQSRGWNEMAKPLGWKDFVTKPWVGKRGKADQFIRENEGIANATCLDRYRYDEIKPCSEEDSQFIQGLANTKYENQHDGSGRAYPSIIDLRRDKIINHLSVANFRGTRSFLPFRFEDLNMNGTSSLLRSVEEATGLEAKCNATMGKAHRHLVTKKITKHKPLPSEFIRWMNKYVDWDIENRIGYYKRSEE